MRISGNCWTRNRNSQKVVQNYKQVRPAEGTSIATATDIVTGKLIIDGSEYAVNEEFQQIALEVADALDLDELDAARWTFETQQESAVPEHSIMPTTIARFHERRELAVDCFRMTLQESVDRDEPDGLQEALQRVVRDVLETSKGAGQGSAFVSKCLAAMENTEKWQIRIGEGFQRASLLGQSQQLQLLSILEFERGSLHKQHEALGALVVYLFRGNYCSESDLHKLFASIKRWDRVDNALISYVPALQAAISRYGSTEGGLQFQGARNLNKTIVAMDRRSAPTSMVPFYSLLLLWWLSEYSGWYREPCSSVDWQTVDVDREADERADLVKAVLKDGALELMLAISSHTASSECQHPARQELVTLLLSEGNDVSMDGDLITSDYFRILLMECWESFTEAFISNMPDSIRQLKNDEDDLRLKRIAAMQDGLEGALGKDTLSQLHMECFLVLISFAYEHRPEAAETFWSDPDSNLFGFLQWASKRQTVPRVSAFCEMLCAIAEGDENSVAAHKFLLDDTATTTVRGRRVPSMNYAQMLAEIELYAYKVHEKPTTVNVSQMRKVLATDMNELESPVMLACYLRLITHMCRQSREARTFIFDQQSGSFVRNLLVLSSGTVPSYLRSSIFTTLEALVADRAPNSEIVVQDGQSPTLSLLRQALMSRYELWETFDSWMSGGAAALAPNTIKPLQTDRSPLQVLNQSLSSIGTNFEQYDAFVGFMCAMSADIQDVTTGDTLSFPKDLGGTYRLPGIDPYVDFVCGQLFTKKLPELTVDNQVRAFRLHCLEFIAICLETFNENMMIIVDRKSAPGGQKEHLEVTSLYAQQHPFCRTMEWIFTNDLAKVLLKSAHVEFDDLENSSDHAIMVTVLCRAIDVINLVLDLQPTFFDIVRPLVKASSKGQALGLSTFASFEESIVLHPELITDLCYYAGSSHSSLVLKSLALMQKLGTSRKLNHPLVTIGSERTSMTRVVDMLVDGRIPDSVSVSVCNKMQLDIRELESGLSAPGYAIKDALLAFLNASLGAQPDLPNLAHMLLGFHRVGESLIISSDSRLEQGLSLFDLVVGIVENYPDGEELTLVSWLIHIKTAGLQVLHHLWTSPISSRLTLLQLRQINFFATQMARQQGISQETLWDGLPVSDPLFWHHTSANALAEFLGYRAFLYEYMANEFQAVSKANLESVQRNLGASLLGRSVDADGSRLSHVSIFDLFDFTELDVSGQMSLPNLDYFRLLDINSCITKVSENSSILYDMSSVRELLDMTISSWAAAGHLNPDHIRQQVHQEADAVYAYLEAQNRLTLVQAARKQALHMWTEVIVASLQCLSMEPGPRIKFVLDVLQLVLPKLDALVLEESDEADDLARLAEELMTAILSIKLPQAQSRTQHVITDRSYQLFRTCISGIHAVNTSPTLRERFYTTAASYLIRLSNLSETNKQARGQSMDCVKTAGSPLISIVCDDAEDGQDSSRLAALYLLANLTDLARQERSPFIIDSLSRANTLEIIIDPIKNIAIDFQEAVGNEREILLSNVLARLSLLLQLSRNKEGAIALLDAGLLQAIRDSQLYVADADLGISAEDPADVRQVTTALQNYYTLLSATLRLLVSTFVSRGIQNEQIQYQMRSFLQDYRANVVGVMKRHAGLSSTISSVKLKTIVEQCVRSYVMMMNMTDFVEVRNTD